MSDRFKTAAILCAVCIAVFLCFIPTLDNGFTNWDDDKYLLENPGIRHLNVHNIKDMFTRPILKTYSPLTQLSFALEYRFFQYQPFVYHLNNLLLHIGVVILIFFFAIQCGLSRRSAAFAALLFGVHPIHVESVAWVTERKDVLYAVFYMISLVCYMKYARAGQKRFYLLSLLLGLLSILSKVMALSLPMILLVCDFIMRRPLSPKIILEKIPYTLYIIPITWITFIQNARIPYSGNMLESVLIWIWTLTFYIKKFIWPDPLIPMYNLPTPVGITNMPYILAVGILLAVIFLLIRYRKNRLAVFAFAFYFFSIFFLFRFDEKDVLLVADRYMYLPSLGFCMVIGFLFDRLVAWSTKRSTMTIVFSSLFIALIVSALGFKTAVQSNVWTNPFSLWSYIVHKNPDQARAYDNLGQFFMSQGNDEQALRLFKMASILGPNHYATSTNMGIIYHRKGLLKEAALSLASAVKKNRTYLPALNNLALVLRDQGELKNAITLLETAVEHHPYALIPRLNLALLYKDTGSYDKAEALYQENLRIDPLDAPSLTGLRNLYFSTGRKEKTVEIASKILRLTDDPKILTDTGILLANINHIHLAHQLLIKSLRLDPARPETYLELGKIYGSISQLGKAVAILKEGAARSPKDTRFQPLIEKTEKLKNSESMIEEAE